MYGLEIIVDNTILDLYPDTSIAFEKTNPMFNDIGSHTLNFPIPWTDKNKNLFGFPNRLTTVFTAEKDCICRNGKKILYQGTIIIKSSSDKSGNCFISMDEGDYYYLIKQLLMKDVNYGSDVTLGTTSQEVADYCTAVVPQAYPDVNFNFPCIYNPEFYGTGNEKNADFSSILNTWSLGSEWFLWNDIHEHPTKDNYSALVPFLYLHFIVFKILCHLNFKPLGTFWTNDDLKKLLVYNNYPLDWCEKKYYVKATSTMINYIHYGLETVAISNDSTGSNEDNDNVFDNTGGTARYYISSKGYHEIKFNFVVECDQVDPPPAGTYDFYIYIKETLGDTVIWQSPTYEFQNIEEKTLTDIANFYVDDSMVGYYLKIYCKAVDGDSFEVHSGATVIIKNISYCTLNQYAKSLTYSNHVPDKIAGDWIKTIEDTLGFVSFVDNVKREHRMFSYNDLFTAELPEANDLTTKVLEGINIEFERYRTKQNFTFDNDGYTDNNFIKYENYSSLGNFNTEDDLPNPYKIGVIAFITSLNQVWITKLDDTGETIVWALLTDNWFELVTGREIDTLIEMIPEAGPLLLIDYDIYNIIPRIKNTSSSPAYDTGINDIPNRLMFYNGIKENVSGYNYPQASPFSDSGNLDLTIESINENFKQKYIEWLTNPHRKITLPIHFTADDVRNIRMWEKYKIGNAIGFISSIKSSHKLNSFEVSTVEFYPI